MGTLVSLYWEKEDHFCLARVKEFKNPRDYATLGAVELVLQGPGSIFTKTISDLLDARFDELPFRKAHLAELDLAQLYLPPKQVVRNLDLLVPGRRLQVFELMAAEQRQRQEQEEAAQPPPQAPLKTPSPLALNPPCPSLRSCSKPCRPPGGRSRWWRSSAGCRRPCRFLRWQRPTEPAGCTDSGSKFVMHLGYMRSMGLGWHVLQEPAADWQLAQLLAAANAWKVAIDAADPGLQQRAAEGGAAAAAGSSSSGSAAAVAAVAAGSSSSSSAAMAAVAAGSSSSSSSSSAAAAGSNAAAAPVPTPKAAAVLQQLAATSNISFAAALSGHSSQQPEGGGHSSSSDTSTPVRLFSAEEWDEGEPQAAAAAAAAAAVGGDDNAAAAAAAAAAHPTSYFQSGADWTLSLINLRNRLFPGCHSVPFSSIHDCALPTLAPEPEQPFTVQQFVRELTIVGYEPTGTPQPKQGEAVK